MTEYQCLCAEGMPERCPCNTAPDVDDMVATFSPVALARQVLGERAAREAAQREEAALWEALTKANEELIEIADRTDETTAEQIDSVRALIKDALPRSVGESTLVVPRIAEAFTCNCWYRPDGSRIGYTIADGCPAHPDDQVTDEEVWPR